MSFDYAEITAVVAEIIREFGKVGQWTNVQPGVYDPATGQVTAASVVTDVDAVVFDYDAEVIDGTRVLTGDKQVLMSGYTTGKPDDIFTWSGQPHRVISVKPLAPGGVSVLFEAQVRR